MKKIDIVCFGGNDWWYHNRNHFDVKMMEVLAKYGTVLYINSIVMQKPGVRRGRKFITILIRKAKSIGRGLKKTDVGFWVHSPFSLPVHHIAWLRPLNEMILQFQLDLVNRRLGIQKPIVWVACPAACNVATRMKKSRLVYQRTDRFEEYPNVDIQTIRRHDLELKANADLTTFVNSSVFEREHRECKKALYVDHGVDYDVFAFAEKIKEIPSEMREIKRPIVGFFGGIDDHTSDIGFVNKVTELLPQMSFVFIGQASSDTRSMEKNNVWMLGQKAYEEIPYYGKCFDVAIMPWRQNRWIEACNPIKLKEYLALGKPVVSTPFPELRKYLDVVYEAKSPEQFAACIEKALRENSPERIAVRRKKVEKATWESKARLVLEALFNDKEAVLEMGTDG